MPLPAHVHFSQLCLAPFCRIPLAVVAPLKVNGCPQGFLVERRKGRGIAGEGCWEVRGNAAPVALKEGSTLQRCDSTLLLLSSGHRGTLSLSPPLKTFAGSSDLCCLWQIYIGHVQEGIWHEFGNFVLKAPCLPCGHFWSEPCFSFSFIITGLPGGYFFLQIKEIFRAKFQVFPD